MTDAPGPYEDIIHLPRPQSRRHRPMAVIDRAAQFAPFAALTGYEASIAEEARLTEEKIELGDYDRELLDEKLRLLSRHVQDHPTVRITYFRPDEKKAGGAYFTASGPVRKILSQEQRILLQSGVSVPFEGILELESDLFFSFP